MMHHVEEAKLEALLEAVYFYADPNTWWATLLLPDPPAGAINEDYSKVDSVERPGALARDALALWSQPAIYRGRHEEEQ